MIASDDISFFRHLGYDHSQIYSINYETKILYSLGQLPVEEGDVTALDQPIMTAISPVPLPSTVYLIPRKEDMVLQAEVYVHELLVTPQNMKTVLDWLVTNFNYKYRLSIIQQVTQNRYIWPSTAKVNYDPDTGVATPDIYPYNIFPLVPSFDDVGVKLEVNGTKNVGSVRDITFGSKNIFGFNSTYNGWDINKRKHKTVTPTSLTELGVRGQICEISSTQVFQSRASLTGDTVDASICALFLAPGKPTTFPMTFFPKNMLASSISYNTLDFIVRSRYVNTMLVTNEEYEYVLVGEIRNVD